MADTARPNTDLATHKLTLTTFKDEQAFRKRESKLTLPQWREHISKCSADSKDQLPRLSGLIFGNNKSEKQCFRHVANVKEISAIVAEYDGPQNGVEQRISLDEANATIEKAKLRALLTTTPSHTETEPRWRVIFPLSQHEGNPKVRHEALVAMVNGLFKGQLAPESFTLSQPWGYGKVNGNSDLRVEIIDGDFLNIRDDLFAGRIYKDGDSLPRADRGQSKSRRKRGSDRDVFETFADDMYGSADKAEVEFALSKILADDYKVWMKVGASLADEFGDDEGRGLFESWSKTSDKYFRDQLRDQSRRKEQPTFFEKKWADFSEMTDFGIGTVKHLATVADPNWREQWRQLRREKEDELFDSTAANRAADATESDSAETNGIHHNLKTGAQAHDNKSPPNDDAPEQPKKPPKIKATPFTWIHPSQIPLRQWLYRPYYIRQFVSLTVSTGGVGKSSLLIAEALSMVSGKALLNVSTDGELYRVWYWNGEDPTDELQRRFAAAIKHFELTAEDIGDRLFLDSGRKMRMVLAEDNKGDIKINMDVIEDIVRTLKDNKIDVLIVDPHIASHRVSENDNTAIERVAKAWGYIAEEANCAIMLAHHTRKTLNGSNVLVDDGRGASALRDAVRAARALNNMTKEEAQAIDIDPSQRGFYFRSDNGKANLTPPAERADWFKLVSVDLENNPDLPGPGGDEIGVVTAWEYPTIVAISVSIADIKRAQELVASGPWRRNQLTKERWVGVPIAQALNINITDPTFKTKNKKSIEQRVQDWLTKGLLRIETRPDPATKHHESVEFVTAGRPPVPGDAEGF